MFCACILASSGLGCQVGMRPNVRHAETTQQALALAPETAPSSPASTGATAQEADPEQDTARDATQAIAGPVCTWGVKRPARDSLATESAEQMAVCWLEALRNQWFEEVASRTRFPLDFRAPGSEVECRASQPAMEYLLPSATACLFETDLVATETGIYFNQQVRALSWDEVPEWATHIRKAAAAGIPVENLFMGDGVNLDFIILTTPGGVAAVWLQVKFDPN